MLNIEGTQEDLILFNEAGKKVYQFIKDATGLLKESHYSESGNLLAFKNSNGYTWERDDNSGNIYKY